MNFYLLLAPSILMVLVPECVRDEAAMWGRKLPDRANNILKWTSIIGLLMVAGVIIAMLVIKNGR